MTQEIRTTTGRPVGARGRKTRAQLLACLEELLDEAGYHATNVVSVARRARTSPATFYQYFPDVDAAVLELAGTAVQEGSDGLVYAEITGWWGGVRRAAEDTVDAFFGFWQRHQVVLRVVDLRSAEGDSRFADVRAQVLSGLRGHLEYAITSHPSASGAPGDPIAEAEALTALFAAAAGHRDSVAAGSDVRRMLAHLLTTAVTRGPVLWVPTV
ncbi:TetR family transcriptional regulator [Streptomyces albogriseolus]|uniref:TetR family transcriptional regulator n=1 Tax=Streptomyces albogriseolus TaxID=1887 RepID=UPI0019879FE6|nr:TetR/AcrR family transcriptional regulator [Streptomyces sp.]